MCIFYIKKYQQQMSCVLSIKLAIDIRWLSAEEALALTPLFICIFLLDGSYFDTGGEKWLPDTSSITYL